MLSPQELQLLQTIQDSDVKTFTSMLTRLRFSLYFISVVYEFAITIKQVDFVKIIDAKFQSSFRKSERQLANAVERNNLDQIHNLVLAKKIIRRNYWLGIALAAERKQHEAFDVLVYGCGQSCSDGAVGQDVQPAVAVSVGKRI